MPKHQKPRQRSASGCALGPDGFGDVHGIDLWAIAAELVRKSPDWRMRQAMLLDEEARSGTGPDAGETAPEATRDAVTAGRDRHPIYRLAGPTARLSRLLPYRGFVS